MFFLVIVSGLLSLFIAITSYNFWKDQFQAGGCAITFAFVLCILVSMFGTGFQYQTDHYSRLTFQQYLNGVDTQTEMIPNICTKDGSCHYTYRCAPFSESYTDSNGKSHTRSVFHYCPYVAVEDKWVIHTSISGSDIIVSDHRLPTDYRAWNPFEPIPDWVKQDAGIGTPVAITQANQAIARGDPLPATVISSYYNYILASDNVLVTVSSSQIDHYQKLHVLPTLATTATLGWSNKVQFAGGLKVSDPAAWQEALMRLNMEAGSLNPVTTRFDIQVVLVSSSSVPADQADAYSRTVNAVWESNIYGHSALAKNDAVIIIGTNGKTVTWARGFTLIPTGNGILWQDIQSPAPIGLVNTVLTPQTLIGWPKAVLSPPGKDGTVQEQRVIPSHGAIEQVVVLGQHHFIRQHMSDHHIGSTGYAYLEGDIQPSFWDCFFYLLKSLVASAILVTIWYVILIWQS